MLRGRIVLGGVLVAALLAGGLLFGEQQPTTKGKGKLPRLWSKLGLSDEQRKKVNAIQTEYKVKIDALKTEISKLEEDEKKELAKVLTDAQKQELKRIIATQALSEEPGDEKKTKDEKKPREDKKPGG